MGERQETIRVHWWPGWAPSPLADPKLDANRVAVSKDKIRQILEQGLSPDEVMTRWCETNLTDKFARVVNHGHIISWTFWDEDDAVLFRMKWGS